MSQMATMAVSRRFGAEYAVREVAMAVEPGGSIWSAFSSYNVSPVFTSVT